MKPGDEVIVKHVKSQPYDLNTGQGWIAYNQKVKVLRVMEMTFLFAYRGGKYSALKTDASPVTGQLELFSSSSIVYAKDTATHKKLMEIIKRGKKPGNESKK